MSVRLFEELNMTGKFVNNRRFLTGGWLQVRPREGFWQGWCPELQKGETKKAKGTLSRRRRKLWEKGKSGEFLGGFGGEKFGNTEKNQRDTLKVSRGQMSFPGTKGRFK